MSFQLPNAIRFLRYSVALAALTIPVSTFAQDRGDTVRCSSRDGHRILCQADTSRGVSLLRQLGNVRCVENSTWGIIDRGVWVDRGCEAEFQLGEPRPNRERVTRLDPGTALIIRTTEGINSNRSDGLTYTGIIDQDVRGDDGRLAIPRGATAELVVRVARDNDLILDLDSVTVDGQRYAIDTDTERIDSSRRDGVGANARTGKYVGGGAILGTIIGAIAGGGKGAAIGAASGAAAGATSQILTRGRSVRVPPESLVTFRLEQPLIIGVADRGYDRDGRHYHDRPNDR